jgi:hypothetical protein
MRRAAIVPVCAFAAILGASPARADDAFDAFQQMCFVTHADQTKALAAADQAGWQAMPPNLLATLPAGQVDNPQGRIRSGNGTFMLMLAGQVAKAAFGNVDGNFCAVATGPADSDFVQAATGLANVPPDPSSPPGQNIYFWREKDGAHVQVAHNNADTGAFLAGGPVTMITTQINPQMSLVATATLTAAPQ